MQSFRASSVLCNRTASVPGITPWGRKFRVRVWIPKRGYKHIALYPNMMEAIKGYKQARQQLGLA